MADVPETGPVRYPSSALTRKLSIVAAVLTAAAIAAQAGVKVSEQLGKTRRERAGLEGAIRLAIAATLVRALPSILSEIRTISREVRR